jgi:aminomethyltransferase
VDKGDFVARDVLARTKASGPARRLVALEVSGGVPRPGFPVLHDGVEVGTVASGTFSPTLQRGIATAYVPADLSGEGTRLSVSIRTRVADARVVKTPFVTGTSLQRPSS